MFLPKLLNKTYRLFFTFALFLFSFSQTTTASAENIYADELIQRAIDKNLWEQLQWLALIHYEFGSISRRPTSIVDDPQFFLSATGEKDPKAELEATIRSFFDDTTTDASAQCKFPARYAWLKNELSFDSAKLPAAPCLRFQDWMKSLDAQSITVVFPSTFANNPASAFGHTLVRFDPPNQTEETRQLSYAANYSATIENDDAITYALSGIFGWYKGSFSVEPYYERIKQYADMENRDIWEYQLNFTPEEVWIIAAHLWELRGIYLYYYYFDENCSYLLLSLMEVGRPSLQLTSQSRIWIVPVDTLRTILSNKDLLRAVVYRPSPATELAAKTKVASNQEISLAKDIAQGDKPPFSVTEASLDLPAMARTLDMAYDYLAYAGPDIAGSEEDYQNRSFQILSARSVVPMESSRPTITTPAARPDEGHKTTNLGLFTSFYDHNYSTGISFRPAYHELLDPEGGFEKGSEIQFFNMAASISEINGPQVEHFVPLRIYSLTPRSALLKPLSWKLDLGLERRYFDKDENPLSGYLSGGLGKSYEYGPDSLFYGLLTANSELGTHYDSDITAGPGLEAGVLWFLTNKIALHLSGKESVFVVGDSYNQYDGKLETRITLTPNTTLRLGGGVIHDYKELSFVASTSIEVFF